MAITQGSIRNSTVLSKDGSFYFGAEASIFSIFRNTSRESRRTKSNPKKTAQVSLNMLNPGFSTTQQLHSSDSLLYNNDVHRKGNHVVRRVSVRIAAAITGT
jgi:hypothetical protein